MYDALYVGCAPRTSLDNQTPAISLASAFFPITHSLPRRCICTTRVESRDSQMESTKTIALVVHSVDHPAFFLVRSKE